MTATVAPLRPQAQRGATLGVKPPTRPEDLTPGLLLFFARPSRLQSWAERWGHPWRHVGITVQTPNGLRVASYSARQCYRIDDLDDLLPNYNRVGVASIGATDVEAEVLESWCSGFEGLERKEAPYTKLPVLIGPLLEIARKRSGGLLRLLLLAVVLTYCRFQRWRERTRPAFGCSTFAWQALAQCTNCNIRIPMTAHPEDQAAYATESTPRDELLARWFCTPRDLWCAASASHRSELELDHLVIDLRDGVDEPVPTECPATATGELRCAVGFARAAFVVLQLFLGERLLQTRC